MNKTYIRRIIYSFTAALALCGISATSLLSEKPSDVNSLNLYLTNLKNQDNQPELVTKNGLHWVPLTLTLGKSYEEVKQAIQGTEWRYATSDEVLQTWADDKFSDELGYYLTDNGNRKSLKGIWEYRPGENPNNASPCHGYTEHIITHPRVTENPDGTSNLVIDWLDSSLSEGFMGNSCDTKDDEVGSLIVREAK